MDPAVGLVPRVSGRGARRLAAHPPQLPQRPHRVHALPGRGGHRRPRGGGQPARCAPIWRALHQRRLSKATIARKLAAVRSCFRFLARRGVLEGNPARQVRSPRLGRRLPSFLPKDEATQLLDAAPEPGAAGRAGPGAGGAALRERPARRGVLRARPGRPRRGAAHRARARQGRQGADGAGGRDRARGAGRLPRHARPGARRRSSRMPAADGSPPAARTASSSASRGGRASASGSPPTPCVTASPPTCWARGRTSG